MDQTRLPFEVRYETLRDLQDCEHAIMEMLIRGAPLIGVVAAWGVVLAMQADGSDQALDAAVSRLSATRPTAVNLSWALQGMARGLRSHPPQQRFAEAVSLARAIERSENACCDAIGRHGAAWIAARAGERRTVNILTHCNAGWLATGAWGTALAPIYVLQEQGWDVHVWVDETRPRYQGARLTAWELARAGVAHTVIADNAAGHLMQLGKVELVLVGSDRTTAAGDVCNKIGTYQKALAASDNAIPFLVALPASTIDWSLTSGLNQIPIERRSGRELSELSGPDEHGHPRTIAVTAPSSAVANFAFDVTPARLITALVTEHGCVEAEPGALAELKRRLSE